MTAMLMDCMAAIPCAGWIRPRALITNDENAKNTPAISPHPSAEISFSVKNQLSLAAITPPGG